MSLLKVHVHAYKLVHACLLTIVSDTVCDNKIDMFLKSISGFVNMVTAMLKKKTGVAESFPANVTTLHKEFIQL